MPIHRLNDIPTQHLMPGFIARMLHSESMTFSQWEIQQGAILPEHSHPHEQISILVKGKFGFTLGSEYQEITPGIVVVIPSDVVHKGVALEDCSIIDIFSPVREDYKIS